MAAAGNTDDRKPFMTAMRCRIVPISPGISSRNSGSGVVHLITGIRRNMKNFLMPLLHKLLLRKRSIIETLFDKLKSLAWDLNTPGQVSQRNAFVHILSCIADLRSRATQGQNG